MARPTRGNPPNKSEKPVTTPAVVSPLAGLLRKLEQNEFVHEERWSTLQEILAGIAERIDAVNRKMDALVEWQLTGDKSAKHGQLVFESLTAEELGTDRVHLLSDEDDESLEDSCEAMFLESVVDEALLAEAEEEIQEEIVEEPTPVPQPPRPLKQAATPPSSPPPSPPAKSKKNRNPSTSKSRDLDSEEPLDWVRQREKLLRSLEASDGDTNEAPQEGEDEALQNDVSEESSEDTVASDEPVDEIVNEPPQEPEDGNEIAGVSELELDADAETETDMETSADPEVEAKLDEGQIVSEIDALRSQLADALRKSEMEMSIMRAKMSQERARLEQMEAEIKQREKNLNRQTGASGDKDGAMVSRLKSFLSPKGPS